MIQKSLTQLCNYHACKQSFQSFCTSELVSIAPYCHYVASMITKMKSMRMTYDYLVKLILAVISTEEQSSV